VVARKDEKMVIPRVLLADDDGAVREMLQVALERDGFEVVAVAGV
jgi:CheY-like chemotaxis protein